MTTPIAPPASYATSTTSHSYVNSSVSTSTPPTSLVEVDNGGGGVVPVVAETVCITPNYAHHNSGAIIRCASKSSTGHEDPAPPASSFGTGPDRMESSV